MDPSTYYTKKAGIMRRSDEKDADFGSRKHWADLLTSITKDFKKQISILDIGCGTGRFIYCLKNTDYYLGIDASPHMLNQARIPLRSDQISIGKIDFICTDIFKIDLTGKQFDLIFSIGVLGEVAPFNTKLCKKLLNLLTPGGKLFITIVDIHSRCNVSKPPFIAPIVKKIFKLSPDFIKCLINKISSTYYMTPNKIETCFKDAGADHYDIRAYPHPKDSGWQGTHYDCIIKKRP